MKTPRFAPISAQANFTPRFIAGLCTLLLCGFAVLTHAATVTVSVTSNYTGFEVSCAGSCDGSALATVSGGVGPFQYSWIGPATIGPSASDTITTLCAGSWQCVVIDQGNGNQQDTSAVFTLSEPSPIVITSLTIDQPTCAGDCNGVAMVNATGSTNMFAYAWSNGVTTVWDSMLCAGAYTVTIVDANGCMVDTTALLFDPPPLVANVTASPESCAGCCDGSASVSAMGGTPGYNYCWFQTLPTCVGTFPTLSGMCAGSYGLLISDMAGCTDTITFNITSPAVSFTIGAQVDCGPSCSGSAWAIPSSGTAPFTYAWNDPATTTSDTVQSLCGGTTYTVTVTDALGATDVDSVNIAPVTTNFSVFPGGDVCLGECTMLSAAGGIGVTYQWAPAIGLSNPTIANPTVCPTADVQYYISMSDAFGCTHLDSVYITVLDTPTVTSITDVDPSFVGASDGSVTAHVSGGASPYQYTWNGSLTPDSVYSGLTAGQYVVSVVDQVGCTGSGSTTLYDPVPSNMLVSGTTFDETCYGAGDGWAAVAPIGGFPPYTYLWSNMATTDTIYTTGGSYSCTVTDNSGTDTVLNLSILSATQIMVSLTQTDTACVDSCNAFVQSAVTGGVTPYNYAWSNGGIGPGEYACGLDTGYWYHVWVWDANNCTETDSIWVVSHPEVEVDLGADTVLCGFASYVELEADSIAGTQPYQYQWNQGANTPVIFVSLQGDYWLEVVDANGCTDRDTITVGQVAWSVIDSMTTVQPTCGAFDGSASPHTALPADSLTFQWSVGSTDSAIYALSAGVYTLTVDDGYGCIDTASVVLSDSCGFVWPGDANDDGVADNLDLLPIGQHYGDSGPVRLGTGIQWQAYAAPDWSTNQLNGANKKFVDCDGDGLIDSPDTLAIVQNFGLTHNKTAGSPPHSLTGPDLFFEVDVDSLPTGTPFMATLHLGTDVNPADSVYGLAFTVQYDPSLLDSGSVKLGFGNSWVGTYGTDLLAVQKDFHDVGMLKACITRIDQMDVNGFGPIAVFGGITIDNLSGKDFKLAEQLALEVVDVTFLSSTGEPLELNSIPAEVTIVDAESGLPGVHQPSVALSVFPNPASSKLQLVPTRGSKLQSVAVYSALGDVLLVDNQPGSNVLDVSNIPAGVYLLKAVIDGETLVRQVSIVR